MNQRFHRKARWPAKRLIAGLRSAAAGMFTVGLLVT
jgi:hypothetical protein